MEQVREKEKQEPSLLLMVCMSPFPFVLLFSNKPGKLLQSPFDFLLCFPLFWSYPLASKEAIFPSSHCSYSIIKDCPDQTLPLASQKAKICRSLRCSQRKSPPRSLLRKLSLEQHSSRMPQDAHNSPEQTQKTTVWCPIEWVNGTKTDGRKLTNELEEAQNMSCGPKTPARPRGSRGVFFAYAAKNGKLITWKQKTTIPCKYRFW